jgi:hypothetical protein
MHLKSSAQKARFAVQAQEGIRREASGGPNPPKAFGVDNWSELAATSWIESAPLALNRYRVKNPGPLSALYGTYPDPNDTRARRKLGYVRRLKAKWS